MAHAGKLSQEQTVRILLDKRRRAASDEQHDAGHSGAQFIGSTAERVEQLLAAHRQTKHAEGDAHGRQHRATGSSGGEPVTADQKHSHRHNNNAGAGQPMELLSPESSSHSFEFRQPSSERLGLPGQQGPQSQHSQSAHASQPIRAATGPAHTQSDVGPLYSHPDIDSMARHLPPEQQAQLLEIQHELWGAGLDKAGAASPPRSGAAGLNSKAGPTAAQRSGSASSPHGSQHGVLKHQSSVGSAPEGNDVSQRRVSNSSSHVAWRQPELLAASPPLAAPAPSQANRVGGAAGRSSLEELQRKIAAAMNSMSAATAGAAIIGGPGDGPFDITEFWGREGASPEPSSAAQSEASNSAAGQVRGRGGQEATSARPRTSAPTRQRQGPVAPPAAATRPTAVACGQPPAPVAQRSFSSGGAAPSSRVAPGTGSRAEGPGLKPRRTSSSGGGGTGPQFQPPTSARGPPGGLLARGGVPARPQSAPRPFRDLDDIQDQGVGEARLAGETFGIVGSQAHEFTFRPRINPKSRDLVAASYPRDTNQRILQLSMPKTAQLEKYKKVKEEAEQEALKECTFRPRVGRPPSPAKLPRTGPTHERLYQQLPAWMVKRSTILAQREEEEVAQCTFRPSVSAGSQRRAASAGRQRLPLHLRVPEVLRSRNESLSNARIRTELLGECAPAFQPAINPRSHALAAKVAAEQGLDGVTVAERLYVGTGRRYNQSGRYSATAQEADEQCTFAPAVNPRSRELLATSQELPANFLERQEYLAAVAAEKRALYRVAIEAAEKKLPPGGVGGGSGVWSPGSSTGAGLRRSVGDWNKRSGSFSTGELGAGEDHVTKLAYTDARRSAALKDALASHYYSQYTFAPEINPRSRVIGKGHTFEELYRNDARRSRVLEATAAAIEAQEMAECTFRPSLNPVSLALADMRRSGGDGTGGAGVGDVTDGTTATQEREARLQEARAMFEYQQLQGCTFTPEINREPPATRTSVDLGTLPGMGRYFELQDAARRKAQEEKARQAKVWWQQPKGAPALYTVPQPFDLVTEQRAEARTEFQSLTAPASPRGDPAAAHARAVRRRQEAKHRAAIEGLLVQAEGGRPAASRGAPGARR